MNRSDAHQKSIFPYLIVSGLLFTIAGVTTLHFAILSARMSGTLSQAEYWIGVICTYLGIASMIVLLLLIGSVYKKKKNVTSVAIILLIFFLGLDFFVSFTNELVLWGDGWLGFALLALYGIVRGITFQNVNKGLNIPERDYGNWWLPLLGWSHIVTTSFAFMFDKIAAKTFNLKLAYVAFFFYIAQIFIDGISFGIIGVKMLIDAKNKPKIPNKAAHKEPTEVEDEQKYSNLSNKYAQSEDQSDLPVYCSSCGDRNDDTELCENCGHTLG